MRDPYSILGVTPESTDDEIKKAYYKLARKYHPDNFTDPQKSAMASDKMKEINEAYDEIKRLRSPSSSREKSHYSGSSDVKNVLLRVREYINTGRFTEANAILDSVAAESRNAEWNFLRACILIRYGRYYDAQNHLEYACRMDPSNTEYRETLERLRDMSNYGSAQQTYSDSIGCSVCDICMNLLCINTLCSCCGGNSLRCF